MDAINSRLKVHVTELTKKKDSFQPQKMPVPLNAF